MLEIKLKNTYKKLIHYFSIFTIILGTSFASINSSNAAELLIDTSATTNLALTPAISNGTVLSASPTTDALTIAGAETIDLAAGSGTAASITSDTATDGVDAADSTLLISGITALTITGDITSKANANLTITIDDASVNSLLIGGNVTEATGEAISFIVEGGTSKLQFNGSTAQTLNGIYNSDAGDDGDIFLTGTGLKTFTGIVGGVNPLGLIDIDADTTANAAVTTGSMLIGTSGTDVILGAASSTGTTTLASGTTLTANAILTTGDLTNTSGEVYLNVASNVIDNIILADTAELHIGKAFVTTNNINTSTTSDGAGNFPSTAKIYLPANLTSGETLKITDSGLFDAVSLQTATTTASAINTILQDTALVNYSASPTSTSVITITATDRTVDAAATQLGVTKNTSTAAFQLMTAMDANDISGDTAAYTAFDNALKAQGGFSATEDTSLLQQTSAQDDLITGSTFATKAMTGTVQGIISNRMASLRSGDAYYGMGMSAGNMTAKSGFIQAFGSEVEQKNKTVGSGTQYGYESSSAGFALGFDGTTDTGATVGLSFSMSNTDLDGKGTGKAKNDIDSYTASLYWDKTGQNGYVEGSLTYGLNENKTSRLVNTAGLSRTYTGSYDSNQVSLSLGGGVPNAVGASGYVTPFIGFTGTQITTDAYTESSTTAGDSLRLRVAQDDVNSLVGKVGVKYHNVTDKGTPMISLSLNNEFGDDTINSTNTYQGGGSSFTTSTDVEPLSATLGLGYSYGSDTASIEFAYEAEANDDKYLGHYGSIKIVGKF